MSQSKIILYNGKYDENLSSYHSLKCRTGWKKCCAQAKTMNCEVRGQAACFHTTRLHVLSVWTWGTYLSKGPFTACKLGQDTWTVSFFSELNVTTWENEKLMHSFFFEILMGQEHFGHKRQNTGTCKGLRKNRPMGRQYLMLSSPGEVAVHWIMMAPTCFSSDTVNLSIYLSLKIYWFVCALVFWAALYVCVRLPDPVGLELQTVLSRPVSAGNWT